MHARTRAFSSLKGATLSASPTNWHCSSILLGYLGVSRIKDKSTSLPTQPRMISEIRPPCIPKLNRPIKKVG